MTLPEHKYILGVYPGMYASKFAVHKEILNAYLDVQNDITVPQYFLPCQDADGDEIYVDMKKLLAFYILKDEETPAVQPE